MNARGEAEAPWVYSNSDGRLKGKCAKRPLTMCPSLQGLSSGKWKLSAPSDVEREDATLQH